MFSKRKTNLNVMGLHIFEKERKVLVRSQVPNPESNVDEKGEDLSRRGVLVEL